ncbi:MAG: hypothetical protein ACFE8V_14475 [Promethearchaeota archaeon]
MLKSQLRKDLSIKILEDPLEILNYLQIGISIPILPEFKKYIINDLKFFKAKSILLLEDGNPIGNSLIFRSTNEVLNFGYFGVLNHNESKISLLIDYLINYAKENKFKMIHGPFNIPGIIFGWGFMKEGSLENLFIGKPVNPPIYQNSFLKKKFNVIHEIITWEGSLPRINPWKMKQYDFSDYEFFYPSDFDDFLKYKSDFLRLQADNLPLSARLIPNNTGAIDNYAKFIYEFGENFYLFFVRYKPTKKIVACGACLPNIFRKNINNFYDSIVYFTWAVDPKHRRKGITILMFGAVSLLLWKKKVRYSSGPVAKDNLANTRVAMKLGAAKGRTHLILEYKVV